MPAIASCPYSVNSGRRRVVRCHDRLPWSVIAWVRGKEAVNRRGSSWGDSRVRQGSGSSYLYLPCARDPTFPNWKGNIMLSALTCRVVEFVRNEDGPTAVEYAVMLALIIV